MILSTGMRTDIPAFYPKWLANRFKEGFVLVRNPYYKNQILRYELNPNVIDVVTFCTKNPWPLIPYLDALNDYRLFWFMTITPYGKDIEPNVIHVDKAIEGFIELSKRYGKNKIIWRYDPIFYYERFDRERHIKAFEYICERLSGYTDTVIISFLQMYKKLEKNMPGIFPPSIDEQVILANELVNIAKKYNINPKGCSNNSKLKDIGLNMSGCQTVDVLENALGININLDGEHPSRNNCNCILGRDIGAYNSCMHFCKYCYANYDIELVKKNYKLHDDNSPLLIGKVEFNDEICDVKQTSNIDNRLRLF